MKRLVLMLMVTLLTGCASSDPIIWRPVQSASPTVQVVGYLTLHVEGHPVLVSLTQLGKHEGVWFAIKLDEWGQEFVKATQYPHSSCTPMDHPQQGNANEKWAGGFMRVNGTIWVVTAGPRADIAAAQAEAECLRLTGATIHIIEER